MKRMCFVELCFIQAGVKSERDLCLSSLNLSDYCYLDLAYSSRGSQLIITPEISLGLGSTNELSPAPNRHAQKELLCLCENVVN
jgi:hypothetical protein